MQASVSHILNWRIHTAIIKTYLMTPALSSLTIVYINCAIKSHTAQNTKGERNAGHRKGERVEGNTRGGNEGEPRDVTGPPARSQTFTLTSLSMTRGVTLRHPRHTRYVSRPPRPRPRACIFTHECTVPSVSMTARMLLGGHIRYPQTYA